MVMLEHKPSPSVDCGEHGGCSCGLVGGSERRGRT